MNFLCACRILVYVSLEWTQDIVLHLTQKRQRCVVEDLSSVPDVADPEKLQKYLKDLRRGDLWKLCNNSCVKTEDADAILNSGAAIEEVEDKLRALIMTMAKEHGEKLLAASGKDMEPVYVR